MTPKPAATTQAFHKVYRIKALNALDNTMQYNPSIKYVKVISDLSSST